MLSPNFASKVRFSVNRLFRVGDPNGGRKVHQPAIPFQMSGQTIFVGIFSYIHPMRKHFDNDGVRDKVCLTLWIAGSNIQTGGGKYFLLVKYSTLIMMWVALIPLTLSLSACSGSAREGRSWKQSRSERERWSERRSVVIRFTADNSFQWQTSLFPMNTFIFLFIF